MRHSFDSISSCRHAGTFASQSPGAASLEQANSRGAQRKSGDQPHDRRRGDGRRVELHGHADAGHIFLRRRPEGADGLVLRPEHQGVVHTTRHGARPIGNRLRPVSQRAGRRAAHVYACGQCADESARFIGWLSEPLPPDQQPPPDDPSSEATLIRRETDDKWVRSDSAEGGKIIAEATSGCDGDTRLNYCRPDPE